MQNAMGMLVDRIGVAVDKPDADEWWKGGWMNEHIESNVGAGYHRLNWRSVQI